MNWAALGIVTTIIISVSGGICTLFAAYLNAKFDSALEKMEREILREMKNLGDEFDRNIRDLNGIYLRTGIWNQFYHGEFDDAQKNISLLRDRQHDLNNRVQDNLAAIERLKQRRP